MMKLIKHGHQYCIELNNKYKEKYRHTAKIIINTAEIKFNENKTVTVIWKKVLFSYHYYRLVFLITIMSNTTERKKFVCSLWTFVCEEISHRDIEHHEFK